MTQSWVSQQTLGSDHAQRIPYNPKDAKQSASHHRQGQGDVQLRMTRHPHVAPHKSMLADDLKLSSDEEDSQTVNHEPGWDGHSLSHGRRVRHSSSDSSDSNSSIESSTSSLHSHSSSPEGHPETVAPTNTPAPCSSKETDHPTAAQWQLDKWLKKARKKSSSGEQDPGYPPSPYAQRAPSPARSWDSNQDYSPHQSPISSPQFNYRLSNSPGNNFCPSPFCSTSPSASPVPSPDLSICPSPCGGPSAGHTPSPIPRDPPRSPSPTLPSSRLRHHPDVPSHHKLSQTTLQVTKSRPWNSQVPNSEIKNKTASTEQLHKSRLKLRPAQEQNLSQSKTPGKNSSHSHKTRPNPNSKTVSDNSKSKQTSEQIRSSKSSHRFPPNSHIPSEAKHSESRNKTDHPPNLKNSNSKLRAPISVHVLKKQSETKGQDADYVEGRQCEWQKYSIQETPQGKGDKRESRRLAEEQLKRPWIQSSEEDNEEEERIERRRPTEDAGRGRHQLKRDQHNRHEWHTAQVKSKPPSSASHHHQQDNSRQKDKAKKRSPSPTRTPTPPSPSSSSSSSSSLDTESEYQAPITKVPADSTSQKKQVRRSIQDPSRPNRLKTTPPSVGISGESRQKLYTLVPFGRSEKATAPAQRGLRNLVVQIDLCLLKRVPDSTTRSPPKKTSSHSSSTTKDKEREAMRHYYVPDGKRKRKLENGVSHRESKRGKPYANESSGPTDDNHIMTETTHNGCLEEYLLDSKRPLSPLSPLADSPDFTKIGSQSKTSEKNKEKNRDAAVKPKMEVESVKVCRNAQPLAESWGPSGHRGAVTLPETPHHAEYYLHEAKRMKHRADAMVDKLGKAVNYVDAALSFMECGKAMEHGPLEAKSPYTMYAETVELIRYAMRLKSHSGPGARQEDKQLAVLCFRCLALLYWQMFRLKKDHALKYSKVLLDYFKTSPKVPATAPCWNGSEKGAGGPPASLSPNAKHHGWSSNGGKTSPSFINIPHRIHQMAANHLNITNSVLYSYEYWEVADNLAKENKEFFNYLDTLSGPLTLHSSIAHAVQYTRQALQWIRISAKLN